MSMKEMFIESKSKYNFDKTVEVLSEEIANAGWRLMAIHNLQQSLHNFNYEVSSIKVLELCNPHHAQKILSADELRIYSNLMPCRISVYDKADGKTYISLMNAGTFAAQAGSEIVKDVMTQVFTESLEIAKTVLDVE